MELRWHSEESWKEGNERWICSYFIIYVYKILKEQNFLNEKKYDNCGLWNSFVKLNTIMEVLSSRHNKVYY